MSYGQWLVEVVEEGVTALFWRVVILVIAALVLGVLVGVTIGWALS